MKESTRKEYENYYLLNYPTDCEINGNHDWELEDIDIGQDDGRTMYIKDVLVCSKCGAMK